LDIRFKDTQYEKESYALAQECIKRAWSQFPDILNGNFGQRPHKLTIAIAGMTDMLKVSNQNHEVYNDLLISLFTALNEFEVNHNFYPLKNIDYQLMEMLKPVIEAIMLNWDEKHGELADQLTSMMSDFKNS
jgi:hypothetical protein